MGKPLLPTQELDLVGLDRKTILSRLRWNAAQGFSGWMDYSLASPDNVLLEGEALLIGGMGFSLINERARQSTFATVTDRLAMIRMSTPHGLRLSSATAAQVGIVFSTPGLVVAPKKITIPIGTRLQSGDTIWETQAAGEVIVGASVSGSVVAENSELQQETFTSYGDADLVLALSSYPVVDSSVAIIAADGTYSTVRLDNGLPYRSFLEMDGATRGALVLTDSDGKGYVQFGNGINGMIPQGMISISYKTGGGSEGSVSVGASWEILDAIYDETGSLVTLLASNAAASDDGIDQMSVEEARIRIPMQIRIRERTVNEDDGEAIAETAGGVVRSAVMTSNHSSDIPEDTARLYLVGRGAQYSDSLYYSPAAATATQVAAVTSKLARGGVAPLIMGVRATVSSFISKTVNVAVQIYKTSGVSGATAKAAVIKALRMFFAVADDKGAPLYNVNFGFQMLDASGVPNYELPWSDLFGIIRAVPEIRKIPADANGLLLNGLRDSVYCLGYEFPILGSITVYDMDAGGATL